MSEPRITYWKSRRAKGQNAHVVVFNDEEKFFATKAEAQAHYNQIVVEEDKGGYITSKDAANFDTAITLFLNNIEDRIKAGVAAAGQLVEHRKAARALLAIDIDGKKLGKVLVSDLTAGNIQFTILPGLFEGRAPKSVHNYFSTLRAVMRFSVVKGWASTNPALNVRPAETVGSARRHSGEKAELISPNRIAAIIDAAGDWSTAIAFAASTGLRKGEQRALRWKHIKFDRGFVVVEEAAKDTGEIGSTKTKAGKRDVPLQAGTIALLRELRLASKFSADDDYVFTVDGGLLSESRLLKVLKRACKRADVPAICWHDPRHYFASKMLENMQDDMWTVAQILGHKEIATTQTIYGHWLENDERDQRIKDRFASINF